MFRIQKAITIKEYIKGVFTKTEFIGFICLFAVPELLKEFVHGNLQFVFTIFILVIYIVMCLPIGAKDKKIYHLYLAFIRYEGEELMSFVEDKKTYKKEK